jgi:hypothetical protein
MYDVIAASDDKATAAAFPGQKVPVVAAPAHAAGSAVEVAPDA